MRIGIIGTGVVGSTLGSKLISLGHEVKMGSRSANNTKGTEWSKKNGSRASTGTFADSAAFGEIIFNCTNGMASIDALKLAGEDNLRDKILIDLANPLDFSNGMPPSLAFCNTTSLGEQIQHAFSKTRVVKTLNTVNCNLMVNPSSLTAGDHDIFISGNDPEAKRIVADILRNWFGWKSVIDLGDISTARSTEMLLPLWLTLMGKFQTVNFNFKITR
jgi:8-hydroxy-5-deazaflavin:NADPH oxidoreductase